VLCPDHLQRRGAGVYERATAAGQASSSWIEPGKAAMPADLRGREATRSPGAEHAFELFEQLFPDGVRLTAETFADFQRWAELTERLSERSRAS
jgi:hypothetical protein